MWDKCGMARNAAGLSEARSVSGWLYGTAVRVAMKARTREARRQARERKAALMRPPDTPEPSDAADWNDLRTVLDEELDRLGERYRDPVVLCCLEGRSREEAARLLGWPVGTVSGRLSRAKELLRDRLSRRGVVCSVAALTALLSARGAEAVPPELSRATLAAIAGAAPATVAKLVASAAPNGWRKGAVVVILAATGALMAFAWFPPEPNQPPAANSPAAPNHSVSSGMVTLRPFFRSSSSYFRSTDADAR